MKRKLTSMQTRILKALEEAEPASTDDLAEVLELDKRKFGGSLGGMFRRGIVTKDDEDRYSINEEIEINLEEGYVVKREEKKPEKEEEEEEGESEEGKWIDPALQLERELSKFLKKNLSRIPGITEDKAKVIVEDFRSNPSLKDTAALMMHIKQICPAANNYYLNYILQQAKTIVDQFQMSYQQGMVIGGRLGIESSPFPTSSSLAMSPIEDLPGRGGNLTLFGPPKSRSLSPEEVEKMVEKRISEQREEEERRAKMEALEGKVEELGQKFNESLDKIAKMIKEGPVEEKKELTKEDIIEMLRADRMERALETKEQEIKQKNSEISALEKRLDDVANLIREMEKRSMEEERKKYEEERLALLKEIRDLQKRSGTWSDDKARVISDAIDRGADIIEKGRPLRVLVGGAEVIPRRGGPPPKREREKEIVDVSKLLSEELIS